ncbi:MAG: ATP-binding protein, partial [Desertimonas sp.]
MCDSPGSAPTERTRGVFVFTDVVGSTRRWETETALMTELMRAHDDVIATSVEQAGGEIVKRTGDGVLALFDVSSAAAGCAIEIQRRLPTTHADRPIEVRIGVHAGEAERRNGDLYGPAVNTAARVMHTAHGGQIVTTDEVRALIGGSEDHDDALSFRPLGRFRLKGIARPLALFQLDAPGRPVDFPRLTGVGTVTGNLPALPAQSRHRERETRQLTAAVDTELVTTLVGPGGVGKTWLALHVATTVGADYPDGVWFVDLAAVRDPGSVAIAIASTVGIQQRSELDLAESIGQALSARTALIILDNCEHLVEEVAGVVRHVATGASQSRLLCTSQRRLGLDIERVIRLEPLGLDDAVRLFEVFARRSDPGFGVSADNHGDVARLCRSLDGLPLAIELAAARAAILGLEGVNERLHRRFTVLRSRRRDGRHDTLEATIAWSVDLLTPVDRTLLGQISV